MQLQYYYFREFSDNLDLDKSSNVVILNGRLSNARIVSCFIRKVC